MLHNYLPIGRKFKTTTKLSVTRLILGLGLACISTIWTLYMSSFGISDSMIGFIASGLVAVSLFVAFFATLVLEKFNVFKILLTSLSIQILVYLSIIYFDAFYVFMILSVIITIAEVFRIASFDILFRDQARKKELNEDEGLMYSLINIGWLIGPLIAGFFLVEYGIKSVFLIAVIFMTMSLLMLAGINVKKHPIKKDIFNNNNVTKNFIKFFSNKKLRLSYLVSLGICIWLGLIFIYMPLFIVHNQIGKEYIGFFLSAFAIPLILFEYIAGKLSQKYGFKAFFVLGFLSLAIIAFLIFIINNIYATMLFLIISGFALAFLEPLQDSYFFYNVRHKKDDSKYYPIYSTSASVGSFIGKISIATILLFLPERYAYLITGIFMLIIGIIFLLSNEK